MNNQRYSDDLDIIVYSLFKHTGSFRRQYSPYQAPIFGSSVSSIANPVDELTPGNPIVGRGDDYFYIITRKNEQLEHPTLIDV